MLVDPSSTSRGNWLVAGLSEPATAAPSESDAAPERSPARPPARLHWLPPVLAFSGAFALILVYALRGGSYDIVVRQEQGLVIWWIIAVGLALGILPRAGVSRHALLLLGAVVAYLAWTALSLAWTESSESTFAEVARTVDYLGVIALAVVVLDRRTWRAAAAGLGLGALVVCALALASRLAPSHFPIDYAARNFQADRLDYPFGYWNAVGAWGAMSVAIGLAWSAHDRSRLRRAIALAFVPVAGIVTYLTYSRAGVAAVVLAVLAVLAFSRNRLTALVHTAAAAAGVALAVAAVRSAPEIARATGTAGAGSVLGAVLFAAALGAGTALCTRTFGVDSWRVPRRVARGLLAATLTIAVAAAAALGPSVASDAWHSFRHTSTAAPSANPTQRLTTLSGTRYDLWAVALHGFGTHPSTGTGPGTFGLYWSRNQRNSESVRNTHNIWLENMEELGTPGLLLILSAVLAAIVLAAAARRRSRRTTSAGVCIAVLAAFVVYLLSASVDWMWQSTAITVLALGAVGVLAARLGNGKPRIRWLVRMALVGFAVLAGAVQVPGLLATTELRRSQAAARAGHPAEALAWARDAIAAEPWAASGYEQRGLVLEADGRLSAAAADLRRAISREPTNYVHWLLLARIQTERGRYAVALRDYDRARALGRRAQVFLLSATYGIY